MKRQTFATDKSLARIASIMAILKRADAEGGTSTAREIMAETGLSSASTSLYLRHLIAAGVVDIAVPANMSCLGGDPARYSPVLDNAIEVDDFPRSIAVRTTWPPHHLRDALCCYLFGVPAAMQAAA